MGGAREAVALLEGEGYVAEFDPAWLDQKDAQGIWTGTSEPLAPEIYQYNFMVDGARVTDPSNARLMTAYRRMDRSFLLVPGDNVLAASRTAGPA